MNQILYLDGVSVSFDGFKALSNLSFYIDEGELRAIIGPNGAGKTTLMDVVTGKTRPSQGKVEFKNKTDLTSLDEAQIANLGIGRKFQKPTIFENQTVFENLELALSDNRELIRTFLFKLSKIQIKRINEVLEITKLESFQGKFAGELSHGQKQWLEIGMLLMQNPVLMLIDEPAAGMTDTETFETAELLKSLSGECTIIVVEHDMEFIRELNCKVTVLNEGSVLAEGSIESVKNNKNVIESYLGR